MDECNFLDNLVHIGLKFCQVMSHVLAAQFPFEVLVQLQLVANEWQQSVIFGTPFLQKRSLIKKRNC